VARNLVTLAAAMEDPPMVMECVCGVQSVYGVVLFDLDLDDVCERVFIRGLVLGGWDPACLCPRRT